MVLAVIDYRYPGFRLMAIPHMNDEAGGRPILSDETYSDSAIYLVTGIVLIIPD
jgi:hypothetical protein